MTPVLVGQILSLRSYNSDMSTNRKNYLEYQREYYKRRRADPTLVEIQRGRQRKWARAQRMEYTYGLSEEEADTLVLKECAICKTTEGLVIDHKHNSLPNIRGILCGLCNRGIGQFRDDPTLLVAAAEYLRLEL